MTDGFLLEMSAAMKVAIWKHLLPASPGPEQAAFAFAVPSPAPNSPATLCCREWQSVPPEGFETRSAAHFELATETQAAAIKRAHDLGASLVEFHSHFGQWPAAFSPSDIAGFEEFVPHVLWRIKNRPYVAVVVASTGFDGFVWSNSAALVPEPLAGLVVSGSLVPSTGLSRWDWGVRDGS